MSSAVSVSEHAAPIEPSPVAALLSFVVPGLGQLYQGRHGKGILFMVSLLGMFALGQAMGRWQNVYLPRGEGPNPKSLGWALTQRWHYLGQFWIGAAAWPAVWQFFREPPVEDGPILQNYQRMPREAELNRVLVNSDKSPDLGWVYTVVAGMLNLLVIYDAYAGPLALAPSRPTGQRESLAPKEQAKSEGAA